jgi:glucose-6-phosphate dehydrogenase assembly protein OpcA
VAQAVSRTNGAATAAQREIAVHRRLMRFGEAETTVAPIWSERDTSVASIAGHLSQLWSTTAGATPHVGEKGLPHARASVLNLIVTVPDAMAADRVVHTLLGLGFRHPSRAIVLVADPDADGPPLDAAVSAHCHPTNEVGEQVCFEEVVLTIRGEAAEHLNGVVAALLIHDLPTHVWWPGDPPFNDPVFDQLVEVSDRLIVDPSDFSDLLFGLRRLTGLRHRSGIGDLSWKRLGWWQELTAQFFDAPRFRRYLPNLNRLSIQYALPGSGSKLPPDPTDPAPGVADETAQAMLYAAWMATRLTWKRYATTEPLREGRLQLMLEGRHEMVDLRIEGVETDAVPAGELVSVRLRAYGETGAAEFIIDRHGEEATVATNADGMTAQLRRVRMNLPTESELLASSLVSDGHDALYEAALRGAAVLLAAARSAEAAG